MVKCQKRRFALGKICDLLQVSDNLSQLLPTLVSEKLLVLKMSGSKLRLPLLLRRAGEARLLGDSGFRGSAEPTWRINCNKLPNIAA